MRAEIIAVLAREGEIPQAKLKVLADKLLSVGINTANVIHVRNLPEMSDAARSAFNNGNMPVFLYSMQTNADKAIKKIVCENLHLSLKGSKGCLANLKKKLSAQGIMYSNEHTYFAIFPDSSKIFENPNGILNGFLSMGDGKAAMAFPTQDFEIVFDKSVIPMFHEIAKSFEEKEPQREKAEDIKQNVASEQNRSTIKKEVQPEPNGAIQSKVIVGVCGVGKSELIKRLSNMLKCKNPKMSVLSRQEDVQIKLTAFADSKEEADGILAQSVNELRNRFKDGVYGINVPDIYCAAGKKLIENQVGLAIVDPYTRGGLAARMRRNGLGNVIAFEENSGTQRTKIEVLGVPEKLIKKKGAISAPVALAMAAGAKKASGAKVAIAILGVPYGQGDKKLPEGTVFIAIDSDNGSRVKTLNIPEKFTKEQMGKIAAFEAANQLRLYDEAVLEDSVDGRAVNRMSKANARAAKNAPAEAKNEKKSFLRKVRDYFIPMKGDDMVDIAKKLVMMLAIVVFVGSMSYIVYYNKNASGTKDMYDGIKDFVIESNEMVSRKDLPKGYPEKYQPKFVNLWKENEDIAGWIKIDNTIVDYPVVQRPGDKNIYYYRKDFNEKYNKYGVPFVDYETDLSKPSTNTIVYGHNMADGQMFGVLEQYKSLEFFKSNPIIDFNSVYEDGEYLIFGVFLAATREQDEPFNYHHFVNPKSDEEYNTFISEVKKRSFYNVPIDITPDDELLTLSTCTYTFYKNGKAYKFPDGRLVVIGRKVRDGEDYSSAVAGAGWQDALMPKPYYDIDDSTPAVGEKPLEALTLSETSIQMQIGETKALTYATTPEKTTKTTLKWSSSDPGVASVDKGKITAIKNGTTTITISTEDGRISASAKVVVGAAAPVQTSLSDIYFAKEEYNIQNGESVKLSVKTDPAGYDLSALKLYYSSSDENVASVSEDGYVTADELGRAVISVSTADGKYSAQTVVNVVDGIVKPTGIKISRSGAQFVDGELHAYEGQKIRLRANITPSGATETDVQWSTSDKNVISVNSSDNGDFTVKGSVGDVATISVATSDGKFNDSIYVRIVEGETASAEVEDISLNPESDFEMVLGSTKRMTAYVSPENASDKSVTWSTGNSKIATISSSGVITAHAEGTTYIKAKANDKSGLTAQVNVTVKKSVQEVKVTGVELSTSDEVLDVGGKVKVTASVSPSDATNKGVSWSSSNSAVASVSAGNVTAKAAGTATITARTEDGGFIAKVEITVNKPETPVEPDEPTEPETPVEPEIPETPETPDKTPEASGTPSEPEAPIIPSENEEIKTESTPEPSPPPIREESTGAEEQVA